MVGLSAFAENRGGGSIDGRMRILITNDDGIHAEGLKAMARAARTIGEPFVVAPDYEKSACGHGMTLREPLRITEAECEGARAFMVNGLPVDCVNVGLEYVLDNRCDLVLSGINNGPNLGFDVTYSGTVAGAMEGCINNIRSIAVSMATFVSGAPYHYETGEMWLSENLEWLIELELPDFTFLNINVPAIAAPEIEGHAFVEMGQKVYDERLERRDDPWGRPYYWQGGVVVTRPDEPGTDVFAVANQQVAITPISIDWTNRAALESLKSKEPRRSGT